MPIKNQGLRTPTYTTNFEVYEGEEYQKDLEARNWGLMSNRGVDRQQIEAYKQGIASGAFTDEQVAAILHRNPYARQELSGAIPPERRIMSQFSTPAKPEMPVPFVDEQAQAFGDEAVPGFVAQPQGLVERIDPAVPAMFKEESREQAALAAEAQGLFGAAQKIRFGNKLNKGSQAAVRQEKGRDPWGWEVIRYRDPYSGQLINESKTGKNVFDQDIRIFSERVQKAGIPGVVDPLRHVSEAFVDFEETGKTDGVGYFYNTKAGKVFLTEKGKKLDANLQRLQNIEIKNLSGSAVSAFEQFRNNVGFMRGMLQSGSDFMNHYKNTLLPSWQLAIENLKGGLPGTQDVPDAALARYMNRVPQAAKMFDPDYISIDGARKRRNPNVGETVKPTNKPAGSVDMGNGWSVREK